MVMMLLPAMVIVIVVMVMVMVLVVMVMVMLMTMTVVVMKRVGPIKGQQVTDQTASSALSNCKQLHADSSC
eukprot:9834416-Alexandrium_andersonii.AAC.1